MSTIQFNHFEKMSYSTINKPLNDEVCLHFANINIPSLQQKEQEQQKQRLASHTYAKTPLQRSQESALPSSLPQHKASLQQETRTSTENQQSQQYAIQFSTSTASATVFSSPNLDVENVMPGIYLTKNFIAWNEENLRSHGFTHIIIIDKHIQELYYPSPVFKLSTENNTVDAFDTFDYFCHPASTSLKFGKEFEAIDLNFGEKSYLTTVLPNCYRAVQFINNALQAGGIILVIDCNGGEQKCLTIIVAYLMYKYNINFSNAFTRLKDYYKKADLDRFYISQLYEYEPILQVQRAQSRGHSCSRELNSAILKRKKMDDDHLCATEVGNACNNNNNVFFMDKVTIPGTNEFFNTFNPLSHFIATTAHSRAEATGTSAQQQRRQQLSGTPLQISSNSSQHQPAAAYTNGGCALDDYSME